MYSSVFIFIFVFILGMPVRVPSGLSLALSLCWWPCGWQCHGSPGKATGYSSERRRKNWSFHPHCATVLHSQFIQLAMALYLSFTFQSLIFKISTHWCIHQYKKLIEIYIYIQQFFLLAFFQQFQYSFGFNCFHLRHLFEALRLGAGLGRAWPLHAVVQACAGEPQIVCCEASTPK